MSEMKFTPGPWSWFTKRTDQDRKASSMRFLVGSDGQGFAHTVGLNSETDSANADLIAAAPELLEALSFYVAICVNTAASVTRENAQLAYETAIKAIQKATGGAQ